MLKMMCSQPPCMNIDVKIVRNAGGCDRHRCLHRSDARGGSAAASR